MTTNSISTDSLYDPEFTADISNKMQVPQRISVIDQDQADQPKPLDASLYMQVPDRILVTGQHAGMDNYPSIEEEEETWPRAVKLRQKTTLSTIPNGGSTTPPAHTEDDLSTMRRQMRTLSRRIMLLEQDNQQRQQREVVLYSVGVLYFLVKGLVWLQRHW
ncbi:mitochondrial fission factor-like [Ornithodoros turicata]|uniref:mitochondrial fission factor-like n=1 Tax=Ornithodoros turicata TaxID=34597 RepID=UPI0031390951